MLQQVMFIGIDSLAHMTTSRQSLRSMLYNFSLVAACSMTSKKTGFVHCATACTLGPQGTFSESHVWSLLTVCTPLDVSVV